MMTDCIDQQERLNRLIFGLRLRIEEAHRGGGSCAAQLEQCSILELLDLTLRDLEMRKAELECAVTMRRTDALLSGSRFRASAAHQEPDLVASWAGFQLQASKGHGVREGLLLAVGRLSVSVAEVRNNEGRG